MYIIHICACVWNFVGSIGFSNNWVDYYGYSNSPIYSRYNAAVYWATMTMTTVGYGDVTPKNDIETLTNNITMLIGTIVFAYSVNSIGIFVSNIYRGRQEYNRSVTILNSYMSRNKVPFNLQTRIRSYLKYIWTEEKQMNEEEVGSIVNKLSSHLQEELDSQMKGYVLSQCKVIAKTFSLKFQKQLLFSMEELSFSPEERIININQIDDCSLYIIMKGEIDLIFEGINQNGETLKRNKLQRLRTGDYFGEIAFFTEQPRTASAIARGFVRVYKIKRENLLKLLNQYPNDKEKFYSLKDRLIAKDSVPLITQCYSCQSPFHNIHQCHILHFCPDREAIIKRSLYPQDQRRRSFRRKKNYTKIHPWITTNVLSSQAKYLSQRLVKEEDDEEQEDEFGTEISPEKYKSQSEKIDNDDDMIMTLQMKNVLGQNQQTKNAGFLQQVDNQSSEIKASNIHLGSSNRQINIPEKQVNFHLTDEYESSRLSMILSIHKKKQLKFKISFRCRQYYIKLVRVLSKKKSMTKTKDVSMPSDGFGMIKMAFQDNFEKLMQFNYYFPLNNFDVIIKRYSKFQKTFGKKRYFLKHQITVSLSLQSKKDSNQESLQTIHLRIPEENLPKKI